MFNLVLLIITILLCYIISYYPLSLYQLASKLRKSNRKVFSKKFEKVYFGQIFIPYAKDNNTVDDGSLYFDSFSNSLIINLKHNRIKLDLDRDIEKIIPIMYYLQEYFK